MHWLLPVNYRRSKVTMQVRICSQKIWSLIWILDCSIWPSTAVLLFLELYGSLHSKFMTTNITEHEQNKLWEEIAAKMKAKGFEYTSKECANKLFNLKRQYKVCKRHNATPGIRKRSWQYYDVCMNWFILSISWRGERTWTGFCPWRTENDSKTWVTICPICVRNGQNPARSFR